MQISVFLCFWYSSLYVFAHIKRAHVVDEELCTGEETRSKDLSNESRTISIHENVASLQLMKDGNAKNLLSEKTKMNLHYYFPLSHRTATLPWQHSRVSCFSFRWHGPFYFFEVLIHFASYLGNMEFRNVVNGMIISSVSPIRIDNINGVFMGVFSCWCVACEDAGWAAYSQLRLHVTGKYNCQQAGISC